MINNKSAVTIMKDSVLHFLLLLFVVSLLSLIAIRKFGKAEGFSGSASDAAAYAAADGAASDAAADGAASDAAADGAAVVPEGQGSSSSSMVAAAVPEGQGSSSSSMAIREVAVPPVGSSSSSIRSILKWY